MLLAHLLSGLRALLHKRKDPASPDVSSYSYYFSVVYQKGDFSFSICVQSEKACKKTQDSSSTSQLAHLASGHSLRPWLAPITCIFLHPAQCSQGVSPTLCLSPWHVGLLTALKSPLIAQGPLYL